MNIQKIVSNHTITFKKPILSDIELLIPLIEKFYEYDGHSFCKDRVTKCLIDLISDSSFGEVLLVLDNTLLIGYTVICYGYSLEFAGRDAYIDEIFLLETYRERGIGTLILEKIKSLCSQVGVKAIHIEVERQNISAQKFYTKKGFEDNNRFLMTKWI